MRPSVTEQLQGLGRILADVIAPELKDPYAADILTGVCAALQTLAAGWERVPAFLRWDAAQSASILHELLESAGPALEVDLAADISAVLRSPAVDAADIAALQAYHRQVRAALDSAIPTIAETAALAAVHARVVALFRERSQRYPLTTIWRPPVAQPAPGGASADRP